MIADLRNVGSLIETNLEEQMTPLASGFSDMFENLFCGFLSNLNQQQRQKDNGLMTYLPILGTAGIGIFLINKK